jgi:hypothetical protein
MTVKNKEVFRQIKEMLKELNSSDPGTHAITMFLLEEVFIEYNTGTKRGIEKLLYQKIDAEARLEMGKETSE